MPPGGQFWGNFVAEQQGPSLPPFAFGLRCRDNDDDDDDDDNDDDDNDDIAVQ